MRLTIKDISKAYGKTRALVDFTAELTPGIYALLGPNGSGKSTLKISLPTILRQTVVKCCMLKTTARAKTC